MKKYKSCIPKELFLDSETDYKINCLLENKIYLPKEDKLYKSESYLNTRRGWSPIALFKDRNEININVFNEIIADYLSQKEFYWKDQFLKNKILIETRLKYTMNDSERLDVLKQENDKFINLIISKEMSSLFNSKKLNENNYQYIRERIDYSTVVDYVIEEKVDYNKDEVFKEWSQLSNISYTLEFIRSEIDFIDLQHTKKKSKNDKSKYFKDNFKEDYYKSNHLNLKKFEKEFKSAGYKDMAILIHLIATNYANKLEKGKLNKSMFIRTLKGNLFEDKMISAVSGYLNSYEKKYLLKDRVDRQRIQLIKTRIDKLL